MNKREFVLAAGGSLAGGGTWAAVVPPAAAASSVDAVVNGSLGHWRSRLGERFDVFGAAVPAQLVLRRVDEHQGDAHTTQFSLVFEAARGGAQADGSQVLRATTGGPVALYLAQAGADASGTALLRADFCHLA